MKSQEGVADSTELGRLKWLLWICGEKRGAVKRRHSSHGWLSL